MEGKEIMKKLLSVFLILMLLVSTASAAEWAPGLGPEMPYSGMTEPFDLESQLGAIMFGPNASISVAGTKTLFIYLPRQDVSAGDGNLVLRSSDNGEEFRTRMDDTTYVTLRPMTEHEMDMLLWGSGMCFQITLPKSVRLGTSYTVDLGRGSLRFPKFENDMINGQERWRFVTISEYGVNAMQYRRANANGTYQEGIVAPKPGDEIRFDLALGGEAKKAIIYIGQGVSFEDTNFTEDTEVIGVVTDDESLAPGAGPVWGVIFLNENNEEVEFISF